MKLQVLLLLLAPGTALALAPDEFADGIELTPQASRPVQELTLPEPVYAGVVQPTLADLRVFNAEGLAVPHALCEAPAQLPAAAPRLGEQALPVFALRKGAGGAPPETRVDIQRGDTEVHVEMERDAEPAAASVDSYVVDLRELALPVQALRLAWNTADGASALQVRVESSTDLDRWQTVVDSTTLLQADGEGRMLERVRIPLPEARYAYLRLQRADDGPPPRVDAVIAETIERAPAAQAPYAWFRATALPVAAPKLGFGFDAARLAPVESARVELPAANMTLRVVLQHRPQADASWQTAWSGEVFAVDGADGPRRNADLAFARTSDRWWRLQVTEGMETLGAQAPALSLGYRPQTLRFLAQGGAPFLLAYGSGEAAAASARACDELLAQLPGEELSRMLGHAEAGAARALGGEARRQPAEKPKPMRLIMLWVVLIFGSAMLLGMALSVLRRARS